MSKLFAQQIRDGCGREASSGWRSRHITVCLELQVLVHVHSLLGGSDKWSGVRS